MDYHPLLAAVYQAYSLHKPLVLSPDSLWLTISQGVAHHMAIHGERLRNRLVAHSDRLELRFESQGWVAGTPENPWSEAFESWSAQIRDHVGAQVHDALICDFSTTTAVEKAASQVVMLDIFQKYFRYVMVCICGIPEITLRGEPSDWERLATKIDALEVFDMPWWLEHLRPLAAQFVRASNGDVDPEHWKNICKLESAYGGHLVNGWVAKLFPYLRAFYHGPCTKRNPIFETGRGFQTMYAPSGLSMAPFVWQDLQTGSARAMQALGGLVGVVEHDDAALEPIAGWAIREASAFDVLVEKVKSEHTAVLPSSQELDARNAEKTEEESRREGYFPHGLGRFYFEFVEARLFDVGDSCLVHIHPQAEIAPIDWGEEKDELGSRGPDDRTWHRFASLHQGEYLAINLDPNCRLTVDDEERHLLDSDYFYPICVVSEETRGKPGQNPVIALDFFEFLNRLHNESTANQPYWRAKDFQPHEDADTWTRKETFEAYRERKRQSKRR